ncbi:MAG: inorganic diphosphatase [Rickettsiales bacterium]|jgi:inorganic pyrophosphatase|nr:inorganic diphosphatase [Rickettsiales bacterium]
MSITDIGPGGNPPKIMTAIIEVPEDGHVKYEIDKETGILRVDRILHTPLAYPANYGYFPGTLGDDGDPLDAVVVCNAALRPGVMIEVRPIGVLNMKDNAGGDEKIICVPTDRVDPFHTKTSFIDDLPPILRAKIEYFFYHYKDLEPNAWSRVLGWGDRKTADRIIMDSIRNYEKKFAEKQSAVRKKK